MPRPKTLAEGSVTVKTQIPAEVEAAVDDLVAVSGGISKAAILRQAILAGLQQFAATHPGFAAALANAPAVEAHHREPLRRRGQAAHREGGTRLSDAR